MFYKFFDFCVKVIAGLLITVITLWLLGIAFKMLAFFGLAILGLSFILVATLYYLGSSFLDTIREKYPSLKKHK